MAAGKIGIPEGQADLPLKPHRPSWEGPKVNFPPVLSEMDSGGDPPLLKCCLLLSGLTWNPENSEVSGSNWMRQKEAEWWLATSKDQVGVISNYGNGRQRKAAITGVWLVQTYGAGELITTFLEVK